MKVSDLSLKSLKRLIVLVSATFGCFTLGLALYAYSPSLLLFSKIEGNDVFDKKLPVLNIQHLKLGQHTISMSSALIDTRQSLYGGGVSLKLLALVEFRTKRVKDMFKNTTFGARLVYSNEALNTSCKVKLGMGLEIKSVWWTCSLPNERRDSFPVEVTLKMLLDEKWHETKPYPVTLPVGMVRILSKRPLEYEQNLTICVGPLFSGFYTDSLISFIEYHKLIGVEKIAVYDYAASVKMRNILQYYVDEGVVHHFYQDFYSCTEDPDDEEKCPRPHRMHTVGQGLSMYDCYLRFAGVSKYILFTDLDEYLGPYDPNGMSLMEFVCLCADLIHELTAQIQSLEEKDPTRPLGSIKFRKINRYFNESTTVQNSLNYSDEKEIQRFTFLASTLMAKKHVVATGKLASAPILIEFPGLHVHHNAISDSLEIRKELVSKKSWVLHHVIGTRRSKASKIALDDDSWTASLSPALPPANTTLETNNVLFEVVGEGFVERVRKLNLMFDEE